jgi:hypothetical protein
MIASADGVTRFGAESELSQQIRLKGAVTPRKRRADWALDR